jgi:hypothetical protein
VKGDGVMTRFSDLYWLYTVVNTIINSLLNQ